MLFGLHSIELEEHLIVVLLQSLNFLQICLLLGVANGKSRHIEICWVCVMRHLPTDALEVLGTIFSQALVNDIAITHENQTIEKGECLT